MMEEWDELFSDAEHGELTEKQKKIIQAAIEMFAEKGYSATSTNEIARKAGVAEGTIFRHYKTKKDLLVAIVTPVMRRLVAPFIIKDINKVLDKKHETFESFLRAMIDNRKKFIEKHWPIIKILLQEIPFHPELKEMFITYVAPEPLEKAKRLITDFQKRGQIITRCRYPSCGWRCRASRGTSPRANSYPPKNGTTKKNWKKPFNLSCAASVMCQKKRFRPASESHPSPRGKRERHWLAR